MQRYDKAWERDGTLLCYLFYDNSRETLDFWLRDLQFVLDTHTDNAPLDVLIVVRFTRVENPQALQQLDQSTRLFRQVAGRTAIVVNTVELAEAVSKVLVNAEPNLRQRQIFAEEAQARAWLLSE
ncbi:MAG: hypothetical protein ACOYL5_07505 [Phototrophicaceae bacterium]|jgi:hypothetical protein